jgi:hypothetical protein
MTSKNKPVDQKLYDKIKEKVQIRIPKHSAYRSGTIVTEYKKAFKKKYGNVKPPYTGTKNKSGLSRWFKEDWRNQRGEVGYKFKSDVYRPTHRITKDTPTTFKELTKKQITKARQIKRKKGRIVNFKNDTKRKSKSRPKRISKRKSKRKSKKNTT